ncbi:hypothetical protein BVRB_2g040730 isoform A [Beta vulgaris subsp. vulgaris]|nr:hypothetical protein BVRB_2g040730 isoform A [Beta vulgaris subsp. vulgaris]
MGCASSMPDRTTRGPSGLNPVSEIKLVLLGDSGVGKSCIRFVRDQFDPTSKVAVGASFLSQTIALYDSTTVKLEIWDTACQERFELEGHSGFKRELIIKL